MTTFFQLAVLGVAGVVFYLFFRQLFSGNYPQRGVDFGTGTLETEGEIESGGRISRQSGNSKERMEELLEIADMSLRKGDNLEAKKALQSALVLDENNPEVLRMMGVALMNMNDYPSAREVYEKLLKLDIDDDLAHSSLANALHGMGEENEAMHHHKTALEIDPEYAPHYYNYANTLYDLGRLDEAKELYTKAIEHDPDLEEAKEMLKELAG